MANFIRVLNNRFTVWVSIRHSDGEKEGIYFTRTRRFVKGDQISTDSSARLLIMFSVIVEMGVETGAVRSEDH